MSSSAEEVIRVDRQAEEIGAIQGTSLKNGFMPMLTVTLQALDAPVIFMRTKALRALGQIITSDPSILAMVSTSLYIVICRLMLLSLVERSERD